MVNISNRNSPLKDYPNLIDKNKVLLENKDKEMFISFLFKIVLFKLF